MNVSGNTPLDEVRTGLRFDDGHDTDDYEDIQLKPGTIQGTQVIVYSVNGSLVYSAQRNSIVQYLSTALILA